MQVDVQIGVMFVRIVVCQVMRMQRAEGQCC